MIANCCTFRACTLKWTKDAFFCFASFLLNTFFSIFLVVSGRPCSFLKKKHQMHFQNCAPSLHFLFNKIFWLLVWAKCVVMPFVCVANTRQLLTFLIWPLPLKIPTYLYTELNLILRCTARISRKMAFLSIPLIRRLLGIHAGYDQCW